MPASYAYSSRASISTPAGAAARGAAARVVRRRRRAGRRGRARAGAGPAIMPLDAAVERRRSPGGSAVLGQRGGRLAAASMRRPRALTACAAAARDSGGRTGARRSAAPAMTELHSAARDRAAFSRTAAAAAESRSSGAGVGGLERGRTAIRAPAAERTSVRGLTQLLAQPLLQLLQAPGCASLACRRFETARTLALRDACARHHSAC